MATHRTQSTRTAPERRARDLTLTNVVRRSLATFRSETEPIFTLLGARLGRIRLLTSEGRWTVLCDLSLPEGPSTRLRLSRPGDGERSFTTNQHFRAAHDRSDDPRSRACIEAWCREFALISPAAVDTLGCALDRLLDDTKTPEPARAEALDGENTPQLFADEGSILAPLTEFFRRHYRTSLDAVCIGGSDRPSLRFPDVALGQNVFMGAPPAFTQDALLRAYLADLGFAVSSGSMLSTVPTPARFMERRGEGEDGKDGYVPALLPTRTAVLSARQWLGYVSRGRFPINLYSRYSYLLTTPWRVASCRLHHELSTMWNSHFHALGHDMALHVFTMHRIPSSWVRRLAQMAATAGRTEGGRHGTEAAWFFEGPLTRLCTEIWREIEDPRDFAGKFDARIGGVVADHWPAPLAVPRTRGPVALESPGGG